MAVKQKYMQLRIYGCILICLFYLLDPDTEDQACQRYSSQENQKKVGPYSVCHDRELTGAFPTANTAGTFRVNLNFMTLASFVCDFYDEENELSRILYR